MGLQNFSGVNQLPKSISVRRGGSRDVNYIKDIDMKSYQYPWPHERWVTLSKDETYYWCVASRDVEPVGFAVWRDIQFEVPRLKFTPTISIERLAVKPFDRGEGIGTALLSYIYEYAEDHFFNRVVTVVPEINCLPGDPDDISAWLLLQGFKAERPILRNCAYRYGEFVDCYLFAKSLRELPNEPTE